MKLIKQNDETGRGQDDQQQPNETNHGTRGAPAFPHQAGVHLSGPPSLHGGSATGANAGGGGSSALPQTVRVVPIWPFPPARPPRPAAGDSRHQPVTVDVVGGENEPQLLEGRALPRIFLEGPRVGGQPRRSHGQNDLMVPHDLPRPPQVIRLEAGSGDDMRPEPLGHKCEICNLDLAFEPRGPRCHVVPVHVVLPCGHCFHGGCYDEVHGNVGRGEDPPCSRCSQNGDQKRELNSRPTGNSRRRI